MTARSCNGLSGRTGREFPGESGAPRGGCAGGWPRGNGMNWLPACAGMTDGGGYMIYPTQDAAAGSLARMREIQDGVLCPFARRDCSRKCAMRLEGRVFRRAEDGWGVEPPGCVIQAACMTAMAAKASQRDEVARTRSGRGRKPPRAAA